MGFRLPTEPSATGSLAAQVSGVHLVVLAASCVETAHIMLNSKSRHWPTGIANSSGELGKNLCDHLYGNPGYGYLPQLLGQPARPDNIADSTVAWMPRWQNLKNPRQEKFIRGYSVYTGGGCGEFPGYYGRIEGFGSKFKRDIKRYYPATIGALIQAPSLPSSTNYVDVDPGKEGHLRHSSAPLSLSVGRERTHDVGTPQANDD